MLLLDELLKNKKIRDLLLIKREKTEKEEKDEKGNTQTLKVLKYFYNKLKEAEEKYLYLNSNSNNNSNIIKEECNISLEQKKRLSQLSSKYIPTIYLNEILDESKCMSVKFHIGKRSFNINCYRMNNISKADFELLIKSVWMWLYIISSEPRITCVKHLNIIFAFLPHKKVFFTDSNQVFDTIHVNSALTQVCQPENNMLIFRREECFKVFLHESFHCFGLDFSIQDNTRLHAELNRILNLKKGIELATYESYTEFWGEILNMIFNAYYISDDFHSFSLSFEYILGVEQRFSQVQVAKILIHTGIKADETDFKSFDQKTHVLEYYILKSILLLNANAFFEWCIKTNPLFYKIKNNTDFLKFIQKHQNIFKSLGLDHKKIQEIKEILYEEKERKKEKEKEIEILRKTMRMSIVDLL